jgi:hypothetical protein
MTTDSKQLRESMWDLVYGLLSDEERQALVARIKSEPDAARMYSEVKLEAGLVAQAARVEDSSISLKADEETAAGQKRARAISTRGVGGRLGADIHRGAAWLVGLAATALAGLLAVGFSWQRSGTPQLASALVAADVIASQPMLAGLTCPVEVRTYLVNSGGEPTDGAPANVELCLLDRTGNPQFKKTVQTNEIGRATVDLPGAALEPGVRLEIMANKQFQQAAHVAGDRFAERTEEKAINRAAAAVELPIQPEPKIAYYLSAEPVQQADQQVPAAEWYFNAFTAKPAPPEAAENVMIADTRSGGYEPRGQMQAGANLANGAVQSQAVQSQTVQSQTVQSQTVQSQTVQSQTVRSQTVQSQNLARANTQLRALSDKVQGGQAVADFKNQTVVASDQPIPVTVPEQLEGKPLRVAAMNRGVTVANQVVNSVAASERQRRAQVGPGNKTELAKEQLSLSLPPEADGLVEVQLYDESKNQPEPVERQYVVRQAKRRLHIDVPNAKARYSPGEQVALTLRCTDENGKPAADTQLGVRLWNESAIKQSGEEPVLLADAVDQGLGEVVQNEAATPASGQAADAPASQAGQVGRELAGQSEVGKPIELATNRAVVKSALISAASTVEMAKRRTVALLGGAAIVSGVAVVLLLTMLIVLRLSVGWRVMAPGLVVATASVLIGLGWVGWMPEGRTWGGVAMAPAAPAASAVTDHQAAADVKRLDEAAPELSARDRDEKGRVPTESAPAAAPQAAAAPAGAAPALASSSAPVAAAAATPSDPAGQPAAPLPQQSIRPEARGAATPPQLAQSYERGGGPTVTLQVRGGQQARSLRLAKDSEAESVNRRLSGEAGGIAGAAGGRPPAAPPAVVSEQVKQKTDAAEDKKELLAERAAGKPQATAPSSLYFNPQLMTNSDGKATIQFTMPESEAEYRLLVDALGQGRIGSQQQTIICGGAASK